MKKLTEKQLNELNDDKCIRIYEFHSDPYDFDSFDIWQREERFFIAQESGTYGPFENLTKAFDYVIKYLFKDIVKYRECIDKAGEILCKM